MGVGKKIGDDRTMRTGSQKIRHPQLQSICTGRSRPGAGRISRILDNDRQVVSRAANSFLAASDRESSSNGLGETAHFRAVEARGQGFAAILRAAFTGQGGCARKSARDGRTQFVGGIGCGIGAVGKGWFQAGRWSSTAARRPSSLFVSGTLMRWERSPERRSQSGGADFC